MNKMTPIFPLNDHERQRGSTHSDKINLIKVPQTETIRPEFYRLVSGVVWARHYTVIPVQKKIGTNDMKLHSFALSNMA